MTAKADIINGAYSQIRISGITLDPSSEDLVLALNRLENMAAEFYGRNINVNYNFEEEPDINSLHNLERKYWYPFEVNLAVRLLPDFGKQPPQILVMQQQAAFSFLSSSTAPKKQIQQPSRMPRGEANTRFYRFKRFNVTIEEAPLSAKTITMYIGDKRTFNESFSAYLNDGETIASFTIEADTGLTIDSSTNNDPLITYVITATGLSNEESVSLLQVKIVVTTSSGRIETRIINFQLQTSDVIS